MLMRNGNGGVGLAVHPEGYPRMVIKMNGGRRPNQGQGTANQHKQGHGKTPTLCHLSGRGTIQITMIDDASA